MFFGSFVKNSDKVVTVLKTFMFHLYHFAQYHVDLQPSLSFFKISKSFENVQIFS